MNKEEQYLLQLIKSTIHNGQPQEKTDDISWEKIYRLAKFHSIANVAFESVKKLDNKPEKELYAKWNETYNKAIKKDIIQRHELKMIKEYCLKNEIPILLLKGTIMKQYYPRSDLRTMADLDIYTGEEGIDAVQEFLLTNGYEKNEHDANHHREYYKHPMMNVELHNKLISNSIYPRIFQYYKEIQSKVRQIEPFIYAFTLEEEYIYMMVHHYKHYMNAGSGIRHIMDYEVWMSCNKDKANWDYISERIELLGLNDFESMVQIVTERWFGNNYDNNSEPHLLEDETLIIKSGTYGTTDIFLSRKIQNKSKFGFFMERLLPPLSFMKISYPFLNQYQFLIVFCWIHRLVSSMITKRKRVWCQLKFIIKYHENK